MNLVGPQDDLRARVLWSLLSEPGDVTASLVLGLRGPAAAIADLQAGNPVKTWAKVLSDNHEHEHLGNLPDLAARASLRIGKVSAEAALAAARACGARPLFQSEAPEFWQRFAVLGPGAPNLLWLAGDAENLKTNQAAGIVGTRLPSAYGAEVTAGLVAGLAQGVCVVSGGAAGIDRLAHSAALEHGLTTVAYMAGGIDRPYPQSNIKLFHQIVAAGGGLIAEAGPGAAPSKWRFLQRNRLIAAHSDVLVMVEAGYRSGARNTVNHAIGFGTKILTVPGQITSGSSAGCNLLLKEHLADAITAFSDVQNVLDGQPGEFEFETGFTNQQNRALDAMSSSLRTVERICIESGLSIRDAEIELSRLEILGTVICLGGRWRRVQAAPISALAGLG